MTVCRRRWPAATMRAAALCQHPSDATARSTLAACFHVPLTELWQERQDASVKAATAQPVRRGRGQVFERDEDGEPVSMVEGAAAEAAVRLNADADAPFG